MEQKTVSPLAATVAANPKIAIKPQGHVPQPEPPRRRGFFGKLFGTMHPKKH
jgi:hypothetical protein